jgi:hypothetical protein
MSKYKVKILYFNSEGKTPVWWENFLGSVPYNTSLDDDLRPHNAIESDSSDSIEFDSEADFIIFKLKFS